MTYIADGRFWSEVATPAIRGKMTATDPKRTVESLPLAVCFRAMRDIVQRKNKLKDLHDGCPSFFPL